MRILMLGWELPPHNSGGLGIACYQRHARPSPKKVQILNLYCPTRPNNPGVEFMRVRAAHPQDVAEVMKSGMAYQSFKYVHKNGDIKEVGMVDQTRIYEHAVSRIAKLGEFDLIPRPRLETFRAALRAKAITGKTLYRPCSTPSKPTRAGKEFGGNPLCREIERNRPTSSRPRYSPSASAPKTASCVNTGFLPTRSTLSYNHFDPAVDLNFLEQ